MSRRVNLILLSAAVFSITACSDFAAEKDKASTTNQNNTKYVFSNPEDPLLQALKKQNAEIEVSGQNSKAPQIKDDEYSVDLNSIKKSNSTDSMVSDIDKILVKEVSNDSKTIYSSNGLNTAPVEDIYVSSIKESELRQNSWQTQAPQIQVSAIESNEILNSNSSIKIESSGENNILESNSAKVGECYGKVKVLGKYKTVQERVVVQPEKINIETIPAKYEMVTEDFVTKEQSVRYIEVPATYKTVQKQVIVEPEKRKVVTIPAKYETITERVMVQPARKVWKKGRGLIEKKGSDGEIMCLVEEPAVYENISKRVLVEAEKTQTQVIPAVTKTVEMQVVDRPAGVREEIVPAVSKKISKKVLVEPEKTVERKVPATYKTINKKVAISQDELKWLPVFCDYNINRDIVKKLQSALAARGYYKYKIDGVFGSRTSAAVSRFQKELGLDSSGITLITMEKLGIS